jgi:hypothetical protein
VLTREDAKATRRFIDRPLKYPEFRFAFSAVGQRDWPLEIGRADRRVAARPDFFCTRRRIDCRKRNALDAFARRARNARVGAL